MGEIEHIVVIERCRDLIDIFDKIASGHIDGKLVVAGRNRSVSGENTIWFCISGIEFV